MTRDRGAVVVAALLVLAACGGSDEATSVASTASEPVATSPATTPPATTPPATTSPATTSPAVGERVVVLAEEFILADVLSLGIRPVASTVSVVDAGFQGLDEFDTTGIEVLPMTTLSLEHLASLRPDTIITLQFWVDQVGEGALTGMADLITIPDGLSIPDRLTFLGGELDRADEAARIVADLDEATRRARQRVPDDCRVSLAAIYPGPAPAAFVSGPWDLPTAILSTGCELDPSPDDATPDGNGRVYLSLEQLGILDAPTLVLLQSAIVEGEQAAVDEIEANPLWSRLPAVESGDVVTFDRLGYPGAAGQMRFLDEFSELFG